MVQRLPEWKEQRLPPPRTNQSQYDKVGLTRKYYDILRIPRASSYTSVVVDVDDVARANGAADVQVHQAHAVRSQLSVLVLSGN